MRALLPPCCGWCVRGWLRRVRVAGRCGRTVAKAGAESVWHCADLQLQHQPPHGMVALYAGPFCDGNTTLSAWDSSRRALMRSVGIARPRPRGRFRPTARRGSRGSGRWWARGTRTRAHAWGARRSGVRSLVFCSSWATDRRAIRNACPYCPAVFLASAIVSMARAISSDTVKTVCLNLCPVFSRELISQAGTAISSQSLGARAHSKSRGT